MVETYHHWPVALSCTSAQLRGRGLLLSRETDYLEGPVRRESRNRIKVMRGKDAYGMWYGRKDKNRKCNIIAIVIIIIDHEYHHSSSSSLLIIPQQQPEVITSFLPYLHIGWRSDVCTVLLSQVLVDQNPTLKDAYWLEERGRDRPGDEGEFSLKNKRTR